MPLELSLLTIPSASFLIRPESEDRQYTKAMRILSGSLKKMLSDDKTGAYIRGLAKSFNISDDNVPPISFTVLRVGVGELPLAKVAATLSSELKIPNDAAQKMAAELEHDLFAPVAVELNQYLASRKQEQTASSGTTARQAGASNVLDLKNKMAPPVPPPIPRPTPRNPNSILPRL